MTQTQRPQGALALHFDQKGGGMSVRSGMARQFKSRSLLTRTLASNVIKHSQKRAFG